MLIHLNYRSETLVMQSETSLIMPLGVDPKELKVLWLLHGHSGNQTTWMRQTSIERYVEDKKLCVVMPAADRSFYCDMKYGKNYLTHLTVELPELLHTSFGLSRKREDNYIAGLSMGGYGSFKLALTKPKNYCVAASLSGVVDIAAASKEIPPDDHRRNALLGVFGDFDTIEGSPNDTVVLAKQCLDSGVMPKLYMCCGDKDFLFPCNQLFNAKLKAMGYPVVYEIDPDYAHTWDYWDLKIQRVLEWMGL